MKHSSGMLIQSGGSKPFVVSLMGILADEFPYIIFKMGGFVDRDVRGKPGVKSMHASGRAIDIYLDVRFPQEKALGKLLFSMFKDNAAIANTGHVIFDGRIWSPGGGEQSTQAAGVRDKHDDHVHVDFSTTGINGSATNLAPLVHHLRRLMKMQGYIEWVEGYYGPAFNPDSNNTRLTDTERQAIYSLTKGKMSMRLDKAFDAALMRASKWIAAGKVPDLGNIAGS